MVPPTRTKEPALPGPDVPTCAVHADEVAEGLDIHLDFTSGGDKNWEETSALSPVYGGDAARSSYCLNEPSWMQTSEERVFSDCGLQIVDGELDPIIPVFASGRTLDTDTGRSRSAGPKIPRNKQPNKDNEEKMGDCPQYPPGVGPAAGNCIASRMGFSPCGLCAVASNDVMVPPTRTKEPALPGPDVPTCAVHADEVAEGLDIHLDFTTSRRKIGDCPEWHCRVFSVLSAQNI